MPKELDRELTAYCGLYCGDCLRYRSTAADLAGKLLDEFAARDFGLYAEVKSRSADGVKELAHFEQCRRVLESIVALKCEQSCRAGGGCRQFDCRIITCCSEKGYQGCWECGEAASCGKFASMQAFHGDGCLQNLGEIKKYGPDSWAMHRHKFYAWQ